MNDPFSIRLDTIKDSELSRDKRLSWTEEMFDTTGGEVLTERATSQFLGLGISEQRLRWFGLAILFFFSVLLFRSGYLQVGRGDYYYGLAEGNRIRKLAVQSPRGVIFDTTGRQLVKNIPSFNLLITPADLPADELAQQAVLSQVAALVGMPMEDIRYIIDEHRPYIYQPILIKSGLDYDQIITATVKATDWPGVSLEQGSRREYLFSDTADETPPVFSLSHVLGYNGQLTKADYEAHAAEGYFLNDMIGKTGLEAFYEKTLKGANGQKQVEVDALGREKKIIAETDPVAGQDLTLSLDYGLQKTAEAALSDSLKQFNKKRGAVVVMNPQNGEIMALVSLPSFDANNFAAGISTAEYSQLLNNQNKPLFNRVVAGAYPSGSTIKPVMAAAALAEGVITTATSFTSVGGIRIQQWFFPDWKAGGHGVTNVYKAIAESVNTFFYMIGGGFPRGGNPTADYEFEGLGPYRIAAWLQQFGLGQALGLDLNGEANGFVPTVEWKNATVGEQWYIGDTYNLSIGQGNLLVTPLQVASWTATIANGGTMYRPHLVRQIGDQPVAPEVLRDHLTDDKYLAIVREGMRQTVEYGSARSFSALPISVAAKTGTAQWSNDRAPHAWLTAFAPVQQPQIVVTVLVEEGEEGSMSASPVAREILNYYANRQQN
ncbi:penicillin-binding protein 2 [Candidatus Falkowbacteria bacterium]|nr:penicillin-binding protein 2 [Candidatus Falkowbacteria bacterium]